LRGAPRTYPPVTALPQTGILPRCVQLSNTGTGTMAMMPGYLSCAEELIQYLVADPPMKVRHGPIVVAEPVPTPDLSPPEPDPTAQPDTKLSPDPVISPTRTPEPRREQDCRTAGACPNVTARWPYIERRHGPNAERTGNNGLFNQRFWDQRMPMFASARHHPERLVYQGGTRCRFELDLWDELGSDSQRRPAHSFAVILDMRNHVVITGFPCDEPAVYQPQCSRS
jgi:hypothetical protein